MHGTRTVGVLRALEGVEENRLPHGLLPRGGIRLGAQQLLPVGAPGLVGHGGVDQEGEPVVCLRLEFVAAAVPLELLRKVCDDVLFDLEHQIVETFFGADGRRVLAAQEEVPPACRERHLACQCAHGGRCRHAAEFVTVPHDGHGTFGPVRPRAHHDMRCAVIRFAQQVGALISAQNLQGTVLPPGEAGDDWKSGAFEDHQVSGSVAVDDHLPVALPGLEGPRHAVVAVRSLLRHDGVDGRLASFDVKGGLPSVAAHAPGLRDLVLRLVLRPVCGNEFAHRQPRDEAVPPLTSGA